MITCVYNDIKKKEVSQSIQAIEKYEKSLSSLKNKDPRFLIIDILKKTLQISIKQKNRKRTHFFYILKSISIPYIAKD